MKILHTADWHIGKQLHKYYLDKDFEYFVSWLCQVIENEKVDLLLVSGDVFDLANPSSEARSQYYRTLLKIHELGCQVIITGGNHDSISMLNAPKEILDQLNIQIVGGLPENLEDALIPVYHQGKVSVVVAAIPFLRDQDLRKAAIGQSYKDQLQLIQEGIESIFKNLADLSKHIYPNIPCLAMGHLYAAGVESSDSERDIQIGNQALFHAARFGEYYQYIALGHIHKPQRVKATIPTYYSGSPIPLSFSERTDQKRVLLINTDESFEPTSIPIPCFRKLIRISGSLESIEEQMASLQSERDLVNLIEIQMIEEHFNAEKIMQLDRLIQEFDNQSFEIVHRTIQFKNNLQGTGEIFESHIDLSDLHPKEVFIKMIEDNNYESETEKELLLAFQQLLEEVYQNEEAS